MIVSRMKAGEAVQDLAFGAAVVVEDATFSVHWRAYSAERKEE
jgi:hypothetical protein